MKTPTHNTVKKNAAPALTPAERSFVADLVADGLSIQDQFRPEPLYKKSAKKRDLSGRAGTVAKGKESRRRPRR